MKLYERDLPGEFNLKNNFSKDAYNEFLDKLKKDYPELVSIFKNDDYYGYGTWFYEKAFDFYKENKEEIGWGNLDKFVKDFLETDGKYIIKSLNREKENNDKLRDARKTGKVDGKKVWHWDYEDDPDDGTRHQYKADGVNPIDGTYDGVYESTKLNFNEAKEILEDQGYRVLKEDADEPASSRQLWALFCIYKKDFRNQGLTKGEASELIKKGSSERPAKSSGKSLDAKICEHIETVLKPKLDKKMESAFDNQSVVGDADMEGNLIPGRKRYKFFGGGCGYAWIKYDKRNKKLGEVTDRYLDIYRDKYWDKYCQEYIRKFKEKEMGAVLSQDLDVQYTIKQAALDFAESIGINIGKAYVDGRLD